MIFTVFSGVPVCEIEDFSGKAYGMKRERLWKSFAATADAAPDHLCETQYSASLSALQSLHFGVTLCVNGISAAISFESF